MKVVLDTNVLISAFVFPGGAPEDVFRRVLEGEVEMVTSPALLAEFGRVLERKLGWAPERAEAAVSLVIQASAVVRPTETVRVVERDPDDDRVLEAARAGSADVVVTGDKDLLDLGTWENVRMEPPGRFLGRL